MLDRTTLLDVVDMVVLLDTLEKQALVKIGALLDMQDMVALLPEGGWGTLDSDILQIESLKSLTLLLVVKRCGFSPRR